MKKYKVLAVSSPGGHWIQLNRLAPAFDSCDVVYASTYNHEFSDRSYFKLPDASRDTPLRMFPLFLGLLKVIVRERPNCIITTGALPGLVAILVGRILGKKTIWLDSIANSESISMSGKVAAYISTNTFTQWDSLATHRVRYIGRIV
jgi:hypothetical protein